MKRGFATRVNFYTLSRIPKNIGFTNRQKSHFQSPICEKFAYTKLGTLETRILTTGHIRIFRPQNEKISTLCVVPCNIGFANRVKSHFQDAKMLKICSLESSYH